MRYGPIRSLVAVGLFTSTIVAQTAQAPPKPEPPAQAQEQPQPPPRFRVDANFVRVDAYPIKDGKPVLDLTAKDFDIFEDGVPQRVETFEHVLVRAAGPQGERIEPSSQRESVQAAANPRNRVFVIYLDTEYVSVESAHAINEPLIRLINNILGPDDLVGVMTPKMSASQLVLGRKTEVIENSLRVNWPWGTRFSVIKDERDDNYSACFPGDVAAEMSARRKERATLEALEDLVRYLRAIREERKAIITVTEGWLLYRENNDLTRLRVVNPKTGQTEPVPGVDPVGVDGNGKLTTKDPRSHLGGALSLNECETERMRLAAYDNERFFRDLMDEANAANASFYPIDPRGLAAFDNPIGPAPPPPIHIDHRMLRTRIDNLRTLAENTDGIAVVESNDLDKGIRRIADDLTSYYLIGYYSTNSKPDGRFRSLKVSVKKPGVDVRARRGYKAATLEEVNAARRAADVAVPETTRAVNSAIDRLGRARPDARFFINAVLGSGSTPTLWVTGELPLASGGRTDGFGGGATADLDAMAGGRSITAKVTLKPGERTFLTPIPLTAVPTGEVSVRARVVSTSGEGLPITDTMRFDAATLSGQPVLFRRGLSTGNRMAPAADLRFNRTERARLELPVGPDVKAGGGRLLDRAGKALQVPVAVSERTDEATGQRWIAADLVLAPLSAGDYAVEIEIVESTRSQRIVSAIRVVR